MHRTLTNMHTNNRCPVWQWQDTCIDDSDEFQVGVDEAGRGPCFGPVVAAAALLPDIENATHAEWSLVNDSKKINAKNREMLALFLKRELAGYGIGVATPDEIVKHNIRNATFIAMHRAVDDLRWRWKETFKGKYPLKIDRLLVDGNAFVSYANIKHTTIIKGDSKSMAIAAASIIAKTERDDMIKTICKDKPHYNERYSLLSNQGYPTKKHIDGIHKYGITKLHRKKDAPCKNALDALSP